jgi:hypothetical protein
MYIGDTTQDQKPTPNLIKTFSETTPVVISGAFIKNLLHNHIINKIKNIFAAM